MEGVMKKVLIFKRPFFVVIALIFTSINTIFAQQPLQDEQPGGKPLPAGGAPAGEVVTISSPSQPHYSPNSITAAPVITVWHKDDLEFGHNGNPQQWINILGNVSGAAPNNVTLRYKLNNLGGWKILSKGPDTRRLYKSGDFNIEIDIADTKLLDGMNSLEIHAKNDTTNEQVTETVTFNYDASGSVPGSYTIDWSTANSIYDYAQVVDGEWTLMPNDTVRPYDVPTGSTPVLAYDRLIGFGDMSWTDYQVTVPLTIHAIDDPAGFQFPSGGPGVGLILRWQGHYQQNGEQPRIGWHKLGALGWFRWGKSGGTITSGLEMIGWSFPTGSGGYPGAGNLLDTNDSVQPVFGQEYIMKMSVETTADGDYYRFKVWPAHQPEPATWHMEGLVDDDDAYDSGGALLVAHHVDVSFGDIEVLPLSAIRHTVNVTTGSNGTVIKDPNQVDYGFGEDVTITAVPNNGYSFAGWGGDVTGTNNPITISVEKNYNITATFEEVSAPITDDFNSCTLDPVWSFVNPGNDSSAFAEATGDRLEMFVPSGSNHDLFPPNEDALRLMQEAENKDFQAEVKFESVLNKSRNATIQGILVEQDANNYIRFDFYTDGSNINVYHAAVKNGALVGGATTKTTSLGSSNQPYLRITRTGNTWKQEYSDDGNTWVTHNTFSHTMTVNDVGVFGGNSVNNPAHTVLVDYFYNTAARGVGDIIPTTLQTVSSPTNGGSINVSPSSYACGDEITITAVANSEFQFVGWSGATSGTANPKTLTFDVGMEVTANFKEEFKLTVNKTGQGSVTINPNNPGGIYLDGAIVQLTAVPDAGWIFSSWSGITDLGRTATITMTDDVTVTANFVVKPDSFEIYLPKILLNSKK